MYYISYSKKLFIYKYQFRNKNEQNAKKIIEI